jgi:Pyridoxal-phosphate dependent enzyme
MFSLAELEEIIPLVRTSVPPTPQYAWPLLKAQTGVEVVVKHENHTPIGAFKVRGGIVYFDRLKRERPQVRGIVTATRGNHGQSLAFADERAGIAVTIVVPHGNSTEKNALGAVRQRGSPDHAGEVPRDLFPMQQGLSRSRQVFARWERHRLRRKWRRHLLFNVLLDHRLQCGDVLGHLFLLDGELL